MNYPLISVILPVYNVASYIQECIDSLLNQTIQDFELIIIDDASTDNTLNIIRNFNDPRIKIIEKKRNLGLIHSLNLGVENAKGEYVARMDGDDISTLDRFQKQYEVLKNNKEIDVCGCWLQQFGKKNETIKHAKYHEEILVNMLSSCSMSMCSVMCRKEVFKNYRFNDNKIHVEDYDFWSRVAWTIKFYNIQEVLYFYRMHEAQVSTRHKKKQMVADIPIKLFLFKKLGYNTINYSDELISRVLLLDKYISINDLNLFLKWLKELAMLNKKNKVYLNTEFNNVLSSYKRNLLFNLYFEKTNFGITKKWRIKSLFLLSFLDAFWVLRIKGREILKLKFK